MRNAQSTMEAGSVSNLRHVKGAVTVARLVLEQSTHTHISGLQATNFAVEMGMPLANLSTPQSSDMYYSWWGLLKKSSKECIGMPQPLRGLKSPAF